MNSVLVLSRSNRGRKIEQPLLSKGVEAELLEYSGLRDVARVASAVRSHDIVVSDTTDYVSVISFCISRITDTPFILRIRGFALREAHSKLRRHLGRREVLGLLNMSLLILTSVALLRCADARIFVADHVRRKVSGAGTTTDRVVRTPCLKTRDILARTDDKPAKGDRSSPDDEPDSPTTILAVTNFNYLEKVTALADAMSPIADVVENRPDIEFIVAGDGTYFKRFADEVEHLESVRAVGHVEDIEAYYARADVFVHFSYLDGYPSTVVEAAVAGLPVVTNDYDAMTEQIGLLNNGFVAPISDESGVERRLRELVRRPELRRQLGQEGREAAVRTHSLDTVGERLVAAIEQSTGVSLVEP